MAGPLAAVSLGASLIGGISKSRAERKAARQTQQAADINAALHEAQADQADLEARENINRLRREARRYTGTQRARIAASGVVGSEGSPLDALVETAGAMELRALDEARAARARKGAAYAQAAETRRTGRLQASGLRAQGTGTLLSTAATTAGTYVNFKQQGVFG